MAMVMEVLGPQPLRNRFGGGEVSFRNPAGE